MTKRNKHHRKSADCEHRDTTTGTAHGIRRVVCKTCGQVSFTNDHDVVTRQLDPTRL